MAKKKKAAKVKKQPSSNETLDLPVSYPQLFKFTYKTNWLMILKASLMLAIFAIPLFIALYVRTRIVTGITETSNKEDVVINIMSFQGWFGFVILLSFLIFSIGVIGVMNVMKKHIKNEGVIFFRDFFEGIKKNWLSTVLITLLYFGILTIFNYLLNIYPGKSQVSYYALYLVIFIIISILIYMQWILAIGINMIYKCPFGQLLKNAFLMMLTKLPYCLLSLLVTAAPIIIVWFIGYTPVLFGFYLLYIAIGFGNSALLVSLINLYIYDELVNKKQFPEAYRQGLFDSKEVKDEGFKE